MGQQKDSESDRLLVTKKATKKAPRLAEKLELLSADTMEQMSTGRTMAALLDSRMVLTKGKSKVSSKERR